jgi:hypothetical protein
MTRFVWQKPRSKKLTAIVLFLAVLLTVLFYRRPIAIKSIEHFITPQGLYLTCLDFAFDWKLNINVKQACIVSDLVSIEVREAMWQPWSNVLSIQHVKIKHFELLSADNNLDNESSNARQQEALNFPDPFPTLSIVSLKIESFELLQPLNLTVNSISPNELSISGDVNASVKINPNTLAGYVNWRVSDLTKWLPQAQSLYQNNAELLKELSLDESKIKTHLTYNGEVLSADSSLSINSRIYASNCPIDAVIKGNVLVDVDISNLNISLDLSRLSSDILFADCPLIQGYFVDNDLPQLSFVFMQKITVDKTQITLPELQIIDKQNSNQSVVLDTLNYKTTGEFEVNYNISFKQPIKTTKIEAGLFDFQGSGKFSAIFSRLNNQNIQRPVSFKFVDDNHQLLVSDLKIDSILINKLTSEFSVSGTNFNDLQLSIDSQFSQLSHPAVSIQNMTNHIDLDIKELNILSFSGNSGFTNSTLQNIKFLPINVTHSGQASLASMTLSSQHEISLEHGFQAEVEQQQTEIDVRINQQEIISLHSMIAQLKNNIKVKEGYISANIEFTLPQEGEQFKTQGNLDFQGVSLKYQDYVLNNITYQTPLRFDSAGLQLAASTLHVDSIDVGVMVEQFKANVIAQNSVFRLTQVQGEIFNGQFSSADLWLDGREQQFNINIKDIDLAQIVALQKQPGIQITGSIDGDMPLSMGKQGVRIEGGWVSSLTGGKLTIVDNPSFDSIKDQQPKLGLLENLNFTQLESNVKFTPDGWLFFDLALQGNNPDKKQSVNFNYSHQENIFSLLESIRLVKSVENRIEQKITQGDKK